MPGMLYLIPSTIGSDKVNYTMPQETLQVIHGLDEFIVENLRAARRFLRKAGYSRQFNYTKFNILNEHTSESTLPSFLESTSAGKSIGLLSEAGCPCIADPGAKIVAIAHQTGIKVKPLTGPSSIFLALMASGFNGQNFVFHGYLPIDNKARRKSLKDLEKQAKQNNQTQVFMETPYRNNRLLQNILESLSASTLLCIASEITTDNEFIETRSIGLWKNQVPDLHKKNTVFLIYA